LSGPLEPLPPPGTVDPWGLQLSDGRRCVAAQGAHDSFNGRAVDYGCTGAKLADTYVLRGIDRSQPRWRVQTVSHSQARSAYKMGPVVGVVAAWHAKP
jgi:hypothetical protein